MKKYVLNALFLVLLCCSLPLQAQGPQMNCRIGLQYQLSYQDSWGANKPVIVSVQPQSPAAEAGLRVGDVIESIMDRPSSGLAEEEINNLLLNPSSVFVKLKVSSFAYQNKEVSIRKQCRPLDVIGEEELAKAFSHFSVEDVTSRSFVLPFRYSRKLHLDFSRYKTFGIAPIRGGQFNEIDRSMHKLIRQALEQAGLVYKESGADLLVKTAYAMAENPSYDPSTAQRPEGFHNYRYSCLAQEMEDLPFAPLDASKSVGKYRLEMSVSLVDAKTAEEVWQVTAKEQLYEPMELQIYAEKFLPLAFLNFPFSRYEQRPRFLYHRLRYYYSGVYYNTKLMKEIAYVEPQSPAARAGLRAGDIVTAINGVPTVSSTDALVKGYKRFMTAAYDLRDRNRIFQDNSGYTRAMPWDTSKYAEVRQLLGQTGKFQPVFAYLFSYRPYIAEPEVSELIFEVSRAGEKLSLFVKAERLDHSYIELY